ncbi:hypothetical protein [Actinomyces minihominis]|uniref:hypothetical protein n=1 Tax=Actinomyces minihominis TaxID=2002838 RepID=UPI000C087FBD|nr:hypothetical protein [Actinomyces minihominis]
MATARQQVEESRLAMLSCLETQGVAAPDALSSQVRAAITSTGMVGVSTPTDSEGKTDPAQAALAEAASEYCSGQVTEPGLLTGAVNEEMYQRVLDTRACLIDQGYEIPEAPSAQVWIDSVTGASAYSPYVVFSDRSSAYYVEVSWEELSRLNSVCPQGGGMVIEAVAPAL